jgi:hypothetical protein
MRPSPTQPKRRKSTVPRKSRKSASAPPDMSPQPLPRFIKPEHHVSPPRSLFKPELSEEVSKESRAFAPRPKLSPRQTQVTEQELQAKVEEADADDTDLIPIGPVDEEQDGTENAEPTYRFESAPDPDEDQVALLQQQLEGDDSAVILATDRNDEATSPILRTLLAIFVILLAGVSAVHKSDSQSIGYCDRGSSNNRALESLRLQRAEIRACEASLAQNPNSTDVCPTQWPLPAQLLPDACTPCPEHGTCNAKSLTCDTGFIPKSHPVLFFLPPRPNEISNTINMSTHPAEAAWLAISKVFDGLPAFGSVAFPPSCGIDEKRLQYIGSAGRHMLRILADRRGDVLCTGSSSKKAYSDRDGGDARTWGIKVSELKEIMRKARLCFV